ncbi:MAG: RdgB/HAM1 family non-canonical purine NTP pyrophosphatase [Alphaproteobacteria bacterium]|nr:RdgB/HAM1 family non-canonical purine NTP pyrophosphatase [Alphaproteobacteria bacterium]
MRRLLLATRNAHKLAEARAILAAASVAVVGADEAGLPDVAETGTTFEENALIKARAGFAHTGLPTLADDSGLCIRALNDAPGVYSARFAQQNGGYPAVFEVIQRRLGNASDRSAFFKCCIAFAAGAEHHFFTGEVHGRIAPEARGGKLFGYDPIFVPDGYAQTFGELDERVKNALSHRARALEKLVAFLARGAAG